MNPEGRVKRGILDLGGEVLHVLFATVTNRQYEQILKFMAKELNAVIHLQPELITAINQSRLYIQENRQDIVSLQKHQTQVDEYVSNMTRVFSEKFIKLGHVQIQLEMDCAISALELVYRNYKHQVALYHIHRQSLEQGRLTEDLYHLTF